MFRTLPKESLARHYGGERVPSLSYLASLLIRSQSIVAVARGGAEFGPRALGHRSFLAAAHSQELKDRLNLGERQLRGTKVGDRSRF
eukprot:Skav216679  [mRNA]  locus=scaffold91:10140:10400:+ [translate_table: standard]